MHTLNGARPRDLPLPASTPHRLLRLLACNRTLEPHGNNSAPADRPSRKITPTTVSRPLVQEGLATAAGATNAASSVTTSEGGLSGGDGGSIDNGGLGDTAMLAARLRALGASAFWKQYASLFTALNALLEPLLQVPTRPPPPCSRLIAGHLSRGRAPSLCNSPTDLSQSSPRQRSLPPLPSKSPEMTSDHKSRHQPPPREGPSLTGGMYRLTLPTRGSPEWQIHRAGGSIECRSFEGGRLSARSLGDVACGDAWRTWQGSDAAQHSAGLVVAS